jgi:short-subunit dehydrogenase
MTGSNNQQQAIITGASSGIGKATALAFAKAGINVALVSRSEAKLAPVVKAAQAVGVKAKAYPLDLTKVEEVKGKIEEIANDFGQLDILVNNAGIGYTNLLRETSLSDWQQVIQLNLTSVFQCVLGVLPQMRAHKKGMIINVSSIAGKTPFPNWGVYSISKAGLIAFSKTLAMEEREQGIRVVTICPGAVNTPIWETETVKANFNRNAMLTPDLVAESILHCVMLPPQAVIEEIMIMPSAGTL